VFVEQLRRLLRLIPALSISVLMMGCSCGEFFRGSDDIVGIKISPLNTSVQRGSTQQFSATGTFANGGTGDVTAQTTWHSSNSYVASIDSSGLASGTGFGAVTISADCQCYTAKTALTVSSQAVSVTAISVTPADATIPLGATQQFTATATYSNNTTTDITDSATWTSSDAAVATIDSSGLASGASRGNVTITAKSGSISGNTTLTVQ
jgi:uncharacterized protein YjdB